MTFFNDSNKLSNTYYSLLDILITIEFVEK